eukprot:256551-Amphidinium_carterae.1
MDCSLHGADGTFRRVELKAPTDVETWRAAHKVLKTSLMSMRAVSPARLERYSDLVSKFVSQYVAPLWGAIYSAEVKMRHEHMERLRRRSAALPSPTFPNVVWSAELVQTHQTGTANITRPRTRAVENAWAIGGMTQAFGFHRKA